MALLVKLPFERPANRLQQCCLIKTSDLANASKHDVLQTPGNFGISCKTFFASEQRVISNHGYSTNYWDVCVRVVERCGGFACASPRRRLSRLSRSHVQVPARNDVIA